MKDKAFIVWNPFQRRAQTLADEFDLDLKYFHYKWEENGKLLKLLSYVGKSILTFFYLVKNKPNYIFIQLAPTILLYVVSFYCLFTKSRYISDCHNTMIYDDHWIKWPFAIDLLSKSHLVIVHNQDVEERAKRLGLSPVILRDPLPKVNVVNTIDQIAGIKIKELDYVIIPGSLAPDEPIDELFMAIATLADITFVFTWFGDKLPTRYKDRIPKNAIFTGFLPENEFNALFANAAAAIVLTTREGTQPSGASEAIALGVPLILSDIKTTRKIYGEAPVYVDNTKVSIVEGIEGALKRKNEVASKVEALRHELVNTTSSQIDFVKSSLIVNG